MSTKPVTSPTVAAPLTQSLRRDVNALGTMLGETITELAGDLSFHCIEQIRRQSRSRRLGDQQAGATLKESIVALDFDRMEEVIRAFTLYFDFANIAEDRHRIRVLRNREREAYPKAPGESIGAAVEGFKNAGLTAQQVQVILNQISVDLVFTAHPSEAKRRTVRAKLRRMRQYLQDLDLTDLLPAERDELERKMRAEAHILWQTEPLRPQRPNVLDELDRTLALAPRLWEVLPHAYEAMRSALRRHYPENEFDIPLFLRFGSWVGGDRDGHPHVTHEVTAETLRRLRHTAVELHSTQCQEMNELLSLSARLAPASMELEDWLKAADHRWPEAIDAGHNVASEHYRNFLAVVAWRLERSMDIAHPAAYRDGVELAKDIDLLLRSLEANPATSSLAGDVRPWHDLASAFGLHLASLDIRQDSALIAVALADILAVAGLCPNFAELSERERCSVLAGNLTFACAIDETALNDTSREALSLFQLLEQTIWQSGPASIGGFIISMTRAASDMLSVLWLWRYVRRMQKDRSGDLRIIPLFEKIGDLASAGQTMDAILSEAAYLRSLVRQSFRQIIMLGYSDSTKDGGYLAASWGLWKAQTAVHSATGRHGIAVTFFHGRGGSLGRGGGPAARGILSLPRSTFDGSLRLTEQGEVLVERYDDTHIAARHLDQVVWASLVATSEAGTQPEAAWISLLEDAAECSEVAYRDLVETADFLRFFSLATPIDGIEDLPIGSRPARRRARTSLSDLRAIPWVFSWTQNRCLIPAWYGLGAALEPLLARPGVGALLREMYTRWPFFQATIDNAELALAKADLYVGRQYAELADEGGGAVWTKIEAEYERTRTVITALTGQAELLAQVPWFQSSIEARNPYVDPLNLIQIELLRRFRLTDGQTPEAETERLRHLLRLSIQGIAAGLRTTG